MCTVTYTDGVENEEIFADKVCVVEQDSATPAFDGNPTRSSYTFTVPLPPRPPLRFPMTMRSA